MSDDQTTKAIPQMDWQQVALNGGPPCFFVEGPQYCGRAERWPGHGNPAFHDFVSLDALLSEITQLRETVSWMLKSKGAYLFHEDECAWQYGPDDNCNCRVRIARAALAGKDRVSSDGK